MQLEFEQHAQKLGYQSQTAIQTAVFEPLVNGNSVLGIAPTGSGKTVAFTVPLLERVVPGEFTQLIVLEPTAELASQTSQVMADWAKVTDVAVLSLLGGANIKRQVEKLKGHPEVVVGTPGRILNLIELGKLKVNRVTTIVVDEADNLLSEDSFDQVRSIVDHAPTDVQLGFFSATTNQVLNELNKWFIPTVSTFDVRDIDDTQGEVQHQSLVVSNGKKSQMLIRLLHQPKFKALVFFNQTATLEKTASFLRHNHVAVGKLTADQRQTARQKAISDFRKGKLRLLLTTDVAARGMDIAELPTVINYDLPNDERLYVHRSGRTGRMGHSGQVINFGDDHDLRDLKRLIKGAGYELVKVYFTNNQLTTTRPQSNGKVDTTNTPKTTKVTTSSQAGNKADTFTKAAAAPKKKRTESAKTVTPTVPSTKKKHNKKHSKRKGMRHKREQSK